MPSTSPLLSLIIPTYNEAANILKTLSDLEDILEPIPHEIIIVDDDSPDQTGRYAEAFAHDHAGVRVHRRQGMRGLSAAILEGFDLARGDILGVMDADGSHDEKILPVLYQVILDGTDVAVGSRRIPGGGAAQWPWMRRRMSSFATWLSRSVATPPIQDTMSGYFFLRRSVLDSCRSRLNPKGYKILIEICARSRAARVREVPYLFKNRRQGSSKMSWKVVIQFLQQMLILRWDDPLRKTSRPI